MREQLEQLRLEAVEAVRAADSEERLNEIRVRFLGRKGELTALMKGLGALPPEERPLVGQVVNCVKAELEALLEQALVRERDAATRRRLVTERVDITLPGRRSRQGSKHPVTLVIEEITGIFAGLGFPLPRARKSSTTGTTSKRLTSRRNILPVTCRIPFLSSRRCCCAPIHLRCRSVPCSNRNHR